MEKIKVFFKKHWFGICILFIALLAGLLRFYNYENRWGLAYDQAHDVLVARYALSAHKIPLFGPFSSAGPFQTGGEWYWFIMAGVALSPNTVIAPWVFLTLISVVFVILLALLARELEGRHFAIFIGIFAAVSTAQIAQSVNLTNQSPLAIVSLFAIWSAIRYAKYQHKKYLFFLGFTVSLASSIHLQGVSLLLLVLMTLIFSARPSRKGILLLLVGILLPLLPVLIVEIQNNFFNSRNMVQYYLYDQYKISLDVLGRRWLTYAGIFWPNAWAHVIGGQKIVGYIIITSLSIIVVYNFLKKSINKEWYILIASFSTMVVLLRYVRTPLFDSYIVFLHPFIIMLTGWVVYSLYKINKSLGMIALVVLLVGSSKENIIQINSEGNYTSMYVQAWKKTLLTKFPNEKFALYDFEHKTVDKSLPLVLFLDSDSQTDDDGMKIGLLIEANKLRLKRTVINGNEGGHQIVNLNSSTSAQLENEGWVFVNPSAIYKSTEEWYK